MEEGVQALYMQVLLCACQETATAYYCPCFQLLAAIIILCQLSEPMQTSLQTWQPCTAVRKVNWKAAIKASNTSNHQKSNETIPKFHRLCY